MSVTASIIAAILPIILAFVVGIIQKYSTTTGVDVTPLPEKTKELNDKLSVWKKEHGVP